MQSVAKALVGTSTPHFGAFVPPTQEKVNKIKILRDQFQQEWKMLQCSGKLSGFIFRYASFWKDGKNQLNPFSQWDIKVSGNNWSNVKSMKFWML